MDLKAKLTKRETQVVELLYLGKSTKEIAGLMPGKDLSPKTVGYMIEIIKQKLDVGKATEICLWWSITHYKVSVDWTPLQRKLGAMCLLLLLIPELLVSGDQFVRARRAKTGRTVRVARGARRGRRNDTIYLEEI